MRAREAGDEIEHRLVDRLGERTRQPDRQRDAERIAQARRVFRRGESRLSGDRHLDGPALADQLLDPRGRIGRRARVEIDRGHRAEHAQQVVQLVGVAGAAAVDQMLQLELEVGERAGSSRSRSSSAPSRSRSRSRSSDRAAARRSAIGESPSYM